MCAKKQLLLLLIVVAVVVYCGSGEYTSVSTYKKGETIRLKCGMEEEMRENPGLQIMWQSKKAKKLVFLTAGMVVQLAPRKSDTTMLRGGQEVEIKNAMPEDDGSYNCTYTTNPVSQTVHKVEILYLSNITLKPNTDVKDIKKGEDLTLKCEGVGNPQPEPAWLFDGKAAQHVKIRPEIGEMIVKDIKPKHAGLYTCLLNNGVGELSATIRVNVIASDKIVKTPEEEKVTVKTGEDIKLKCKVEGQAKLDVAWYFNGEEIDGQHNEDLMVRNAKNNNTGTYECKLFNQVFGNMKAHFYVNVQPPSSSSTSGVEAAAVESTTTVKNNNDASRIQALALTTIVILSIFFY